MKYKNFNEKLFNVMLDEALERYAHELESEEMISEITDEEINKRADQKQRIYKNIRKQINEEGRYRRKKTRTLKTAGILVAVSVVLLTTIVLNVSAFKIFFFKTYVNIQDTILDVKTDSMDTMDKYSGIQNFSAIDEIIIPGWLPKSAELIEIEDYSGYVTLQYEINEKFLNITATKLTTEQTNSELLIENNDYKVSDVKIIGIDGKLLSIESEVGLALHTVIWNTDTVKYQVDTDVPKIMLDTILSSLRYYQQD